MVNSCSATAAAAKSLVGQRGVRHGVDRLVAGVGVRLRRAGSRAPRPPGPGSRSSVMRLHARRPCLRRAGCRAARSRQASATAPDWLPAVSGDRIGAWPCSRSPRDDVREREAGAYLDVRRIGVRDLAEDVERRVGLAGLLEGLRRSAFSSSAPLRHLARRRRGRRRGRPPNSRRAQLVVRLIEVVRRLQRHERVGVRSCLLEPARRRRGTRAARWSCRPSRRRACAARMRASRSSGSSVPRRIATSAAPFLSPRVLRRSATCLKNCLASASVPCLAARSPDCSSAYSSSGLILRIFL